MSSIARSTPSPGLAHAAPGTDEAAVIRAALQLFSGGRIGEVAGLLEPWLERAEQPDIYTLLARAHASAGKLEEAEVVLRHAETRFPDEPRIWKALAVLFRSLSKPADEVTYRRKLVYLTPDPPLGAYIRLAEASAAILRVQPDAGQGDLRFIARKIAALPPCDDVDRGERLALAQCLYQVPALRDDAYAHYLAASPLSPEQRDIGVGWIRLHEWCERAGLPVRRAADQGRPGFRPMLAELPRVAVLPGFQWMPVLDESGAAISGFHLRRLAFRAREATSPLLLHRAPERSVLRLPRDLPEVSGPALLLGGIPQYYHWTVEHLGTLAMADALGAPPDLPLVVNHDLAPFQLEQFALLGIDEGRLISVRPEAPVRFERLWVATRPVIGGNWVDPLMPAWFRRKLALPEGPGRRKLYLSRGGTGRRRVFNEADLIEALSARGFEVVQPESLSVRSQVELFSGASQIVAPTGAALTNMIFAPPGAQVITIYNRAFAAVDSAMYFDALAKACGHRFRRILASAVAAHESGRIVDADIEVNVEELCAALD